MIARVKFRQRKDSDTTQQRANGFEDTILEFMPQLWKFALHLCHYHELEAEDVLQDSMVRAFRYREALAAAENKYSWLRKTLLTTYLNRIRDNKHWDSREDLALAEELPSFDPMPVSSLVTNSSSKELWDDEIVNALEMLPTSHRTVLLLSDVEGMSREEIAEATGLAHGTVSSQIYRARKKLAAVLESYALRHGYLTSASLVRERENDVEAMRRAAEMGSM